jgi:hypothetical protein
MLFELLDLSLIIGIHAALFGALLLEFVYINYVYFVRCQLNLQLQFLEYNIWFCLDDFCTCVRCHGDQKRKKSGPRNLE